MTRPSCPDTDALIGKKLKVLDHGFVRLVDYLGTDGAIVQAARVSYGKGTKKVSRDRELIRYLLSHRHRLRWSNSSSTSSCRFLSPGSGSVTAPPASMNTPGAIQS